MAIKVKFIGDDLSFYDEVKRYYEKLHNGQTFEYSYTSLSNNPSLIETFKSLYQEFIDIIFLDFEKEKKLAFDLANLINSNGELRKKSLCALHGYKDRDKSIDQAILSQVRINHIKGIEIHDIVYDTMSFLDVDKAKSMVFAKGEKIDDMQVFFDVRITQLKNTNLHVETNLKLKQQEIIELSEHPLSHIAKSKRFFVKNEKDSNLFYNTRFSYDLDFTYIDDSFFRSSEKYWLDFLKYENKKIEYEKDTSENYEQMLRLVKMRRNKIKHVEQEIKNWVQDNKNEKVKKIKVMIFDDELNSIEEVRKIEDFTIKYETGLIYDYYQIRRFNPHMIIFNITEKHPIDQAEQLFNYLETIENSPYIVVTNTDHQFRYKKCVTFPTLIELGVLKIMLEKFKTKVNISSDKERVFFKETHKNVNVESSFFVSIIKLSESEVFFSSDYNIPNWTVLKVKLPIPMILTTVPHLENSEYKKDDTIYRALINGTTELTKADLRVMINQSLEEDEIQVEEQKD